MSRSNVEMVFMAIWASAETDFPDLKKYSLFPCLLFELGA
jgi:hypothetical protein